jgi:hypothetical protein
MYPLLHPSAVSLETAAVAKDYPYGSLRTEMFFFVEEKGKKGHRPVTQSRNPKNGIMNKPHAGTYRSLPTFVVETKAGFFDFVSPPEYPDNPRAQEFIDQFWKQVPEKDQKYIKAWYKIMILRNPNSFKDVVLNYPE